MPGLEAFSGWAPLRGPPAGPLLTEFTYDVGANVPFPQARVGPSPGPGSVVEAAPSGLDSTGANFSLNLEP